MTGFQWLLPIAEKSRAWAGAAGALLRSSVVICKSSVAASEAFHLDLNVRPFFHNNQCFVLRGHGNALLFLVLNNFGLTA
jgi:hypothetical protein